MLIIFNPVLKVCLGSNAKLLWVTLNFLLIWILYCVLTIQRLEFKQAYEQEKKQEQERAELEKQRYINDLYLIVDKKNNQLSDLKQQVSKTGRGIMSSHFGYIVLIILIGICYYFFIGDKPSVIEDLKAMFDKNPIPFSIVSFLAILFLSFITSGIQLNFTSIQDEYNDLSSEIKQLTSKAESLEEELKGGTFIIIFGLAVCILIVIVIFKTGFFQNYIDNSSYENKSNASTSKHSGKPVHKSNASIPANNNYWPSKTYDSTPSYNRNNIATTKNVKPVLPSAMQQWLKRNSWYSTGGTLTNYTDSEFNGMLLEGWNKSNYITYTELDRRINNKIWNYVSERNIGVMTRSAMQKVGNLDNKYSKKQTQNYPARDKNTNNYAPKKACQYKPVMSKEDFIACGIRY